MIPVEKFDPIFLNAFIRRLEQKGFDISTDDRILISRLLIKFYNGEITSLHELKIKIGALLCQTDEEQKIYYASFDQEIELLGDIFRQKKSTKSSIKKTKDKFWVKILFGIFFLGLYLGILMWIRETNTHYQKFSYSTPAHIVKNEKYWHQESDSQAVDEEVWYKAILHFFTLNAFKSHTRYLEDKNVKIRWNLGDGTQSDSIPYNHVYKDTGAKIVSVHYQTPEQDTLHIDTIYVCDPSPRIHPSPSPYFRDQPITFSDMQPTGKEIIWSIDDGIEITRKSDQPLIYSFSSTGTHSVSAKYAGHACNHITNQNKLVFDVEERNSYWILAEELPHGEKKVSKKKLSPIFWIIIACILFILILILLLQLFGIGYPNGM